jgi:hypothetical protein
LQPGRHGQGRGELGVGQCRNELTNSYVPKQKTEKRVEEKSCTFPPMGPRVDGPAGPCRMGLQVTSELEGPTGRVGGARGSHRMGRRVLSEGVAALLTGRRKEMLPG